jgi:hypothetical protein
MLATKESNVSYQKQPSQKSMDELMIFAWAQEHRERIGVYPHMASGAVVADDISAAGVTWASIHVSLFNQLNDLPPSITLRAFIESNHRVFVPLSEKKIMAWAKTHKQKHDAWPSWRSGGIEHRDADGDTWANINSALCFGLRGLDGYQTLAQFIARNEAPKNILLEETILKWADSHREKHGIYPVEKTAGIIPESDGWTWKDVDKALLNGSHGLPKRKPRDTLYWFLERHRKAHQVVASKSNLTVKKIIEYAMDFHRMHSAMPNAESGHIAGTHSDQWHEIDSALRDGGRGFAGGSSLSEFIEEYYPKDFTITPVKKQENTLHSIAEVSIQSDNLENTKKELNSQVLEQMPISKKVADGVERRGRKPNNDTFTIDQVFSWIDHHKSTEGYYPLFTSGKIPEANGKTWSGVQKALLDGMVVGAEKMSLAKFIKFYRSTHVMIKRDEVDNSYVADNAVNKKMTSHQPSFIFSEIEDTNEMDTSLSVEPVLQETIELPSESSGVLVTEKENTSSIESTSIERNTLSKNDGIKQVKTNHVHLTTKQKKSKISESNIMVWIDEFKDQYGEFPRITSGKINGIPNVSWRAVAIALENGENDLPSGGSLSKFIFEKYGVIGNRVVSPANYRPSHHGR